MRRRGSGGGGGGWGYEAVPRQCSHFRSRRSHSFSPVFVSRHAVPEGDEMGETMRPSSTGRRREA